DFTVTTEAGESIPCRITVTAVEETREGLEFEFEYAVVSYILPGQGYALHGDTIDMRVHVRPVSRRQDYIIHPAKHGPVPETKFQMFHDYWRRFLLGIEARQTNWTSASDALLTTQLVQTIGEAN